MNAQAVNTVGGLCQLFGVVLAVRDLLELHHYHGNLRRLKQRFDGVRTTVADQVRRLLRRPIHHQVVIADSVGIASRITATASGVAFHPFKLNPDQPLEHQVATLGQAVNQLREQLRDEAVNRSQAIRQERQQTRRELEAEEQRLRDAIGAVEGKLQRLEKLTTGGVRLRSDGLWLLLVGIIFTTWPDKVAGHVLGWLPWQGFTLLLVGYVAWRLIASITAALRTG
jgi:hypothetical protein